MIKCNAEVRATVVHTQKKFRFLEQGPNAVLNLHADLTNQNIFSWNTVWPSLDYRSDSTYFKERKAVHVDSMHYIVHAINTSIMKPYNFIEAFGVIYAFCRKYV